LANPSGGSLQQSVTIFLDRHFAELGIPKEEREFKPYLTLGRVKLARDTGVFYDLIRIDF